MAENPHTEIEVTLHSSGDVGVIRLAARYDTDVEDLWSALTTPQRLATWYGTVRGDLHAGGEYSASITMSGWDGRGRIDMCDPPRRFRVVRWEEEGKEQEVSAALGLGENYTLLKIEVRGVPLELVWAYGTGWHMHAESLGNYLARDSYPMSESRWDELEPTYRHMAIEALEI